MFLASENRWGEEARSGATQIQNLPVGNKLLLDVGAKGLAVAVDPSDEVA